MTNKKLVEKGERTIRALDEFNKEVLKRKPTKSETKERLMDESKSSVDIEYPGKGFYGNT